MSMETALRREPIVPREHLDFDLQGEIPRFWFDGDPFKTRLFDAMSTLFPEGEKFFINCVRDYRDQIVDPQLSEEVKNFIRQEGQHTKVHRDYNQRLAAQGIDCAKHEGENGFRLERFRRVLPKSLTLAMTGAAEHITAIMSHTFLKSSKAFSGADPRPRAVYMWHGVEEIEHKGVAFDVMKDIAGVGYMERCAAMLALTITFPHRIILAMNHMLEVDGFSAAERAEMWVKGIWWMYGPNGVFTPMIPHYFEYYRPGFHPWAHGELNEYHQWLETYARTGNPMMATVALDESASLAKAA
jgi:predicted metal-dependent hydrolase